MHTILPFEMTPKYYMKPPIPFQNVPHNTVIDHVLPFLYGTSKMESGREGLILLIKGIEPIDYPFLQTFAWRLRITQSAT